MPLSDFWGQRAALQGLRKEALLMSAARGAAATVQGIGAVANKMGPRGVLGTAAAATGIPQAGKDTVSAFDKLISARQGVHS